MEESTEIEKVRSSVVSRKIEVFFGSDLCCETPLREVELEENYCFSNFHSLEMAYDRVDGTVMWQVLETYGVEEIF